uniref:2,3-bisphosphoglycerate-independent phosphoglycerate mutase n=1 Tax=Lygus hesperus TaxID=30085 RepID=A0A0A9XI65_LYGHE
MMLNPCQNDFKRDGLGEETLRRRPKKLEKCHIWRDPDANRKEKRRRSFPNKIKGFLCELRGEERLFLGTVAPTKKRYLLGPKLSKHSAKSQTVREEYTQPERISRAHKDALKIQTKGVCLTDQDPGVIRCEKCDYPLEPQKRRGPPHLFTPILAYSMETQSRMKIKSSHAKPSTAYVNYYGLKDAKVQRVKRRRSSTELYGSMVVA